MLDHDICDSRTVMRLSSAEMPGPMCFAVEYARWRCPLR